MAKRIISWEVDGSKLKAGKYITPTDDGPVTIYTEEFDLEDLFEIAYVDSDDDKRDVILVPFKDFNKVQKHLIIYGVKQKLADSGSGETDFESKMEKARKKWDAFIKGELTGERSNSTGAKENKKIVVKMRGAAEVISLEGLIAKKMITPDSFTEEDQKKLDEFIQIQARHLAKQE